jgi:transcriptional regulator GlxA family with amidase domain
VVTPVTTIVPPRAVGDWLSSDLPPILHVRATDLSATPGFQAALQLLSAETAADSPGSTVIVDRLAEVLLVQAMRLRIDASAPREKPSWLQGLADPRLAAALQLMHAEPSQSWTVTELARAVSMSRSAFASRFRKKVGVTPLDHLTRWRMVYAS